MRLSPVELQTRPAAPSTWANGRLIALLVAVWLGESVFALSFVVRSWPDVVFSLDFTSFWSGASLLRDHVGSRLYDLDVQQAFQVALRHEQAVGSQIRELSGFMPYWNPPPLLLLFLPVSLLPTAWGYFAWLAVSVAAFALSVSVPLRGVSQGRSKAVVLLTYMGVAGTLLEGQVNGILLLAFSLGLLALVSGRCFLGGLLLGTLWLKPQYALLFAFKGRWRETAGMISAGLLIGLTSLAMIGSDGVVRYLAALGQVGGYYAAPGSFASPESMVNWRALLLNLLPSLPEEAGSLMVWSLGIATALLSLLAWAGPWDAQSPQFPLRMLVTVAAILVASSHSHLHGTVLLLAPLTLVLARCEKLPVSSRLWHSLLVSGYVLALVAWVFRGFSWLFVPYLVTFAAVLVFGLRTSDPEVGQ
ncbi:MAG TPA: glycosyltransferase 87 family protein [Chloroflexota bacterium]|nr:glycosyltransferase 87 family protein [Chloroflexota bacterium]